MKQGEEEEEDHALRSLVCSHCLGKILRTVASNMSFHKIVSTEQ